MFFAKRLADSGMSVAALSSTAQYPTFGTGTAADAHAAATEHAGTDLGVLWENLAEFRDAAAREGEQLVSLRAQIGDAVVCLVPQLADDVHDLAGLATVGRHLFGR